MDAHLTLRELYAIFDRSEVESMRWASSAEAAEYLNVVMYLCYRNNREAA